MMPKIGIFHQGDLLFSQKGMVATKVAGSLRNNGTVPSRRNRNRNASGPLLSSKAIEVARRALIELDEGEVGRHIGVGHIGKHEATHRFTAEVAGYNGWEWNAVVAVADGTNWITVSEVALVPGGKALQAPEWVPYENRVLPGDLGPTDVLPPAKDDPRLTLIKEDGAFDQVSEKKLTHYGLEMTRRRWGSGDTGPNSPYAKNAQLKCISCAFFVPLIEPMNSFGACLNEFSADGSVVASDYGCGAHSETPPTEPLSNNPAEAFDDEKTLEF